MANMELKPIGRVRNPVREPAQKEWNAVFSEILIHKRLARALEGLEAFSHLIVFYGLNQSRGYDLKVHPKGREDLPLVGLFATRSPRRPNPLAFSVCRLIRRRGTRLLVKGLDAIDGTPVLDVKPYIPARDCIKKARVPAWVRRLR